MLPISTPKLGTPLEMCSVWGMKIASWPLPYSICGPIRGADLSQMYDLSFAVASTTPETFLEVECEKVTQTL